MHRPSPAVPTSDDPHPPPRVDPAAPVAITPATAPATLPSPTPITRADVILGLLLAWLALRIYAFSSPAVVNPDGLGYLKQLPHDYAAGHLLYLPLLRALAAAFGGDAFKAGLKLSAYAGALSVALCFGCARALVPRRPAVLAAAGLLVSYGAWVQGADVEVYACALAALLVLFAVLVGYRSDPSPWAALAAGCALATAVLFHLTHVLAAPLCIAWMIRHAPSRRRGMAHAAVATATGAALSIAAYGYAACHVRHLDLAGAARFIASAGHGFAYSGTPLQRAADAVYGLARALVWSPYLYESNAQTLLGQFLLGLLGISLLAAATVTAARAGRLATVPLAPLLLWIATYAAMALAFFGSDHERWLFVLPPLWILGCAAIARTPGRAFTCAAGILLLYATNRTTAIEPARRDTWARTRADVASAVLRDGDLVVFPGHSWDEYVGFYTRIRIEPFPLAYYAGLDGKEGCLARLDAEVRLARARGGRVFAVRLFDDTDRDTRGFYELAALGLDRPALAAALARFHQTRIATSEPKITLVRLDDF